NWVMEASDDDNPKLFKLTAAVTAIQPIIKAIQEVFARYPNKKAGVTLANSFPSLAFRRSCDAPSQRVWAPPPPRDSPRDEGVAPPPRDGASQPRARRWE